MSGSLGGKFIRLQVIGGKNLNIPCKRIPAGIYISINVDSTRRWKSAIRVLSSDESAAWSDTVTLSIDASPKLSLDIRASFELDRRLGNGELIGKLETSWDELLDHGDEPFVLSFPRVRGVCPSLTLKAAVVHVCDSQDGALFNSVVDCEIARDTDAGHARLAKYVTTKLKRVPHLNFAVQHFRSVLDQCPIDHPDHAAGLTNLAWARIEGYVRNDLQDIDSTLSLLRDALASRPQGHPDHALSLYHLTAALAWRYSKEHTAVYIRESAKLYCKLLPLCSEGTYFRSIATGASGVDYVITQCNKLPTDASDESIHLRRIVLELCPLGHRLRPIALKKLLRALRRLSSALRSRFMRCGSTDDLDQCIQFYREGVSLYPEEQSDRDIFLNHLAGSLHFRFDHQGKSHDLNEVISIYEEVLCLRPTGHKNHYVALNNLASTFFIRFNERSDIDDINKVISLLRETLMFCPPGNPHRDHILNNLALALEIRYNDLHVSEDLNEAIDLSRDTLRSMRHDHADRRRGLYNLSSALRSRFTHTRMNEDVEEAIRLCQESLVDLPPLHLDRYFSYMNLKNAYLTRYRVQHNPADLSIAVENFRLASRHPTQGFPRRIDMAIEWAREAEVYQHESALEAYDTCLELFDNHVMTRSSIISRREAATAFRGAQSLPVDAASCAIRRDNLRQAAEFVEQGRGQQWSLASRLRTPLEDLESTSPKLASKLSELSKSLSNAQGSSVSTDRAAADRAAIEYRKCTEQWEDVVAEIRNLEGFSRFLLPPSYADLQTAARHGPDIILIASEYLCSAIIVPTSGEPHHIHFPRVTLADLKKLKDDFAKAIKQAAGMPPEEPRKDLRELLRIVWDEIMLPIVNVLECNLELRHRSRIWLCPTADFTSIPLHAAHPFRMKAGSSRLESCLEDLYICSYTPTLSALIRAHQSMKKRVSPSFVAIGQGQPGSGQGKALLAVDDELELVHKLVPAIANCTTISGDAATRAGALEALQQNTWVHIACHGKQDYEQPYNSHFAMKDEPLTLLDIMETNIPHAEFAFLSACHTAVGDEETPDEVIHLAAGLQFSGFKSVVGTLWEVDDAVAKHVVEAFYEKIFEDLEDSVMDCTKAARALNHATCVVKKKVPLEQRIVFIHIGV